MKRCVALLMCCLLVGCEAARQQQSDVDPQLSVDTLLPASDDYARSRVGKGAYALPPHSKFLKGVRICLNAGHGGDAHRRGFKRGPTGVREAEINLRVAEYLGEFLKAAGAEVLMTRTDDSDLSYEQRAKIANEWPADLFVSLHHNAIGNRPHVNYTTVWYHATVDHRPSNLDLARYLCDALLESLALEKMTDVPLKSDQLMYENGFAVLRHAEVTAALTETSFYTNPEEEQRLRDPAYNLQEAYALFMGLARYALAGLPRATLVRPSDGRVGADGEVLVFELDDGLRSRGAWGHERQMILTDSIAVRVDGAVVPHRFNDDGKLARLEVVLPMGLAEGSHALEVQFQNLNKNSVLNPHFSIEKR